MIENNRSSFWAKNRSAVSALVLFSLIAILIGCGGGGGGGGGNGGPGGGSGTIPDAPQNLTASAGDTKVTLNWNASATASSYSVFRATASGGPFTDIQDGVTLTTFDSTGLTNGITYFFKVRAHNVNGFSGDSNTASATPTHVVVGNTWLPGNTIFYTVGDAGDPTASDLRRISPLGTGDTLFALMPNQYIAAAPNPNVTNQLLFAYTTDVTPSSTTVYSIYKNTSVNIVGATKLVDSSQPNQNFSLVGSIGFTQDGQKIFFTAKIASDHGLYAMDPGGTNLVRVCSADDASLSPDGTKVLISLPNPGQDDIAYVNVSDLDTSGAPTHAVLSTVGQDEIMPQWSKDGSKIVFAAESTSAPSPNFEVFSMPFPSGSVVQLTNSGDDNLSPSFSADGAQVGFIRFSSVDVADSGVYKAPSGGGSATAVIKNSSVLGNLYWTSNSGRAVAGNAALTMGRSLRTLRRIR